VKNEIQELKKKVVGISRDNQQKYKLLDGINHEITEKEKEVGDLGELQDYEKEN
jgi:hypothetical protein